MAQLKWMAQKIIHFQNPWLIRIKGGLAHSFEGFYSMTGRNSKKTHQNDSITLKKKRKTSIWNEGIHVGESFQFLYFVTGKLAIPCVISGIKYIDDLIQ